MTEDEDFMTLAEIERDSLMAASDPTKSEMDRAMAKMMAQAATAMLGDVPRLVVPIQRVSRADLQKMYPAALRGEKP